MHLFKLFTFILVEWNTTVDCLSYIFKGFLSLLLKINSCIISNTCYFPFGKHIMIWVFFSRLSFLMMFNIITTFLFTLLADQPWLSEQQCCWMWFLKWILFRRLIALESKKWGWNRHHSKILLWLLFMCF